MKTFKSNKTSLKGLPANLQTEIRERLDGINQSAKRQVVLEVLEEGCDVRAWDTQWGGGTRVYYSFFELETGRSINPKVRDNDTVTPLPGYVLIEVGFFCGKESTPRVTVREFDIAAFCGGKIPFAAPAGIIADWLEDDGQDKAGATVRKLFCS